MIVTTDSIKKHETFESNLAAFIVEKDFGGITVEKCLTYNDEVDIANITFRNTPVPSGQCTFLKENSINNFLIFCLVVENLICGENLGNVAIANVLTELRLSVGPPCAILGKQLLNQFTDYCKSNSNDKNPLMETDAVKSEIAEVCIHFLQNT